MSSPLGEAWTNFLAHWRGHVSPAPVLTAEILLLGKATGVYMARAGIVNIATTANSRRITTSNSFAGIPEGGEIDSITGGSPGFPAGAYIRRKISTTEVEMSAPASSSTSGLTIYFRSGRRLLLSSKAWDAPNLEYWEPLIASADPLRMPGDFLEGGVELADGSLYLVNQRMTWQTEGETLANLLRSYTWEGATVKLRLLNEHYIVWDYRADTRVMIYEGVVDKVEDDAGLIRVNFTQYRSWMRRFPPLNADRATYPGLPSDSVGNPLGVMYGDRTTEGLASPWDPGQGTYDDARLARDQIVGGGMLTPGLVVDGGGTGGKVKVVFAGHDTSIQGSPATLGQGLYISEGNAQSLIDGTGLAVTSAATESYYRVDPNGLVATGGALPTDIRVGGTQANTADNAANALDPSDETSYATLDFTANKKFLVLTLPNGPDRGRITNTKIAVAYDTVASPTTTLKAYVINQATATTGTVVTLVSSTTPRVVTGDLLFAADTTLPDDWPQGWTFGGNVGAIDLIVTFDTASSGSTARIYWAGLLVKHIIQRQVIQTTPDVSSHVSPFSPGETFLPVNFPPSWRPRLYAVKWGAPSGLFINARGQKDTASGTYTGTNDQLISIAPDIMRHLICVHATGDEYAAVYTSGFGSFADARSYLQTRDDATYDLSPWFGQESDCGRALSELANQALCSLFIDRFSSYFCLVPWRRWHPVDYDYAIRREDLIGFGYAYLPEQEQTNSVRVKYAFDYRKNSYHREAFIDASASDTGVIANGKNDQASTVVLNTNDYIDFVQSGTFAAQLAVGEYRAPELAVEVRRAMRAARGNSLIHAGWGQATIAGFNDKLDVEIVGGSTYAATVAAGEYTAEGFAEAAQTALRAADTGHAWTCTYSRSTKRYTITAGGSTFVLKIASGANTATSAWGQLRMFDGSDTSQVTTFSGAVGGIEDHYWIATTDSLALTLKWATGANVAKSAGPLLGYLPADYGPSAHQVVAANMRGSRQLAARELNRTFSKRRDTVIEARHVRLFPVAVDLRDRLFDYLSKPRLQVTFQTRQCPDMQRGRVFRLAGDVDGLIPFPGKTGSTWADIKWRTLSVTQYLGPSWHQEITAIEVP